MAAVRPGNTPAHIYTGKLQENAHGTCAVGALIGLYTGVRVRTWPNWRCVTSKSWTASHVRIFERRWAGSGSRLSRAHVPSPTPGFDRIGLALMEPIERLRRVGETMLFPGLRLGGKTAVATLYRRVSLTLLPSSNYPARSEATPRRRTGGIPLTQKKCHPDLTRF